MLSFPIERLKKQILSTLDEVDFLVLKSTPGSGKTTRVPLFLAEKFHRKIYVLEPRKLAAKLASEYVAKGKGEAPGKSVGHIFKYERCATEDTQIIFLTEGTFLRILASDPFLNECDVVILDEFHERHYYTDVALSFLLKIKERNPRLKVIIMSATINLDELDAALRDRAVTLELNEVRHQLQINYLPNDTLVLKDSLERKVYHALSDVIARPGHVLVFLPGMFEIKKCEEMIRNNFSAEIVVLHGELQGLAIDDSFEDLTNKRIVLSTNIAESSVTIPGVRTVIDSGLHKVSRLNPVTRLPLVELKKISQSSAIQRANRANREDNGLAIRLYSEFDYKNRNQFDVPEIKRTDLSELILTAADLYGSALDDFIFVTALDQAEVDKSQKYLEQIGLIKDNALTTEAKRLSRSPFHPRISKILSEASRGDRQAFIQVVDYLGDMIEPKRPERFKSLARKFFAVQSMPIKEEWEKYMLFGYVDQIAKLKGGNQLVHMNGEVYGISPRIIDSIHPDHPLWIILDVDNRNHVVRLLPIEEEWLYDLPAFPIEESESFDFDLGALRLKTERVSRVGAIVLSREKVSGQVPSEGAYDFVAKKLMPIFQQMMEASAFKRLLVLERHVEKKVNDFALEPWFKQQVAYLLNDHQYGLDAIMSATIEEIFRHLNSEQTFDLERDLPLFLQLHDKRKVPINYDSTNGIHCESYIQDFYGLSQVPTILKGREKIKIHLLGPHKRPLQVTQDLNSFWEKTYKELVGELRRDYPRHYWPDLPRAARPVLLLKNVGTV